MKKQAVAAAYLTVLLALPWAVAQALEVPRGRWWKRPLVVRQLGLSAQQQRFIETITLTHARAMVDLKASVEKAEWDLRVAADESPFEADRVRQAFTALLRARTALEQERFEMILRIREVLSDEQWQRLRRMAKEARGRALSGGEPKSGGGPAGGGRFAPVFNNQPS